MVRDAEKQSGAVWVDGKDPRIKKVARFMRRWHIDEIPQLLNVFKGDMSMVGPRPEREEFIKEFQEKVPVMKRGQRKEDRGLQRYICRLPGKDSILYPETLGKTRD